MSAMDLSIGQRDISTGSEAGKVFGNRVPVPRTGQDLALELGSAA